VKLRGVLPALVTPFSEDGGLDIVTLQRLVRHVIEGGCQGVVALGTTGEGYAVSLDERAAVLEAVREAADPSTDLIAGATEIATSEAIADARLAAELGFGGLMVAPPPYVLPGPSELAEHFRTVAVESGLPTILYDYPARTGVSIDARCLDALVDEPLIIGIKEASGDLARVLGLRRRFGDRFQMICGADSLILDFVLWGSVAWIAGTANPFPAEHVELLDLATKGEFTAAQAILEELLPMILAMEEGGYTHQVREALGLLGIQVGEPRQPLRDGEYPLPQAVANWIAGPRNVRAGRG
jgi:4-hydroxy-tetrahydrodipicolinate synthase